MLRPPLAHESGHRRWHRARSSWSWAASAYSRAMHPPRRAP